MNSAIVTFRRSMPVERGNGQRGNAMFARTSAWMAIGAGALLIAWIVLHFGQFEFATVGPAAGSVLLLLGAVRTLRTQSGGLRLLCGAWGFACGMAWYGAVLRHSPVSAGHARGHRARTRECNRPGAGCSAPRKEEGRLRASPCPEGDFLRV